MKVRAPAVSGTFYPSDPEELRREVDAHLSVSLAADEAAPKALIVPHAGYIYSGPTAGTAYARLRPARTVIKRVVLLGPAHRILVEGLAVSSADGFETPLGVVSVDEELRRIALSLPQARIDDRAHAAEHSIEVQLPFLQRTLDDLRILPLVVGDASVTEVAAVLDAVWGGEETLVVVSTDLSHYHEYEVARRLDARTAAAIVAADFAMVRDDDACGAYPLRGLLATAARRRLGIELIDLRNSGDTAGDRDRVVGYGAFVLS